MSSQAKLVAAGIDVGSSAVKVAVISDEGTGAGGIELLGGHFERLRRRDPLNVTEELEKGREAIARMDRKISTSSKLKR